MENRKLEVFSLVLQGIYCVLCVTDIILCFVYRSNYSTPIGHALACFVLNFTGALFLIPAMPIGMLLNILALRKRELKGISRKKWIIWTIFSPVIYVVCCMVTCIIFVATTGGV